MTDLTEATLRDAILAIARQRDARTPEQVHADNLEVAEKAERVALELRDLALRALPELPPIQTGIPAGSLGLIPVVGEGEYIWYDDRWRPWWTVTQDGVRFRQTYAEPDPPSS